MNRCHLCPGVNKCVPSYGSPGELLFIGEAPGKDENRIGTVFVGKTGQELDDHYLPLAGLSRHSVNITNAIKCLPTTTSGKLDLKRAKDREMLENCALTHLYQEIDQNPRLKLLVPMGALACHAIDPSINLDIQHGFPVMTQWGIMAFPMFHPALGIHDPKKMLMIRTDWMRLKRYLAGTLVVPEDEHPEPDYAEVTDPAEIDCIDYTRPIAMDTEYSPYVLKGPFCATYSTAPGTGRLIRASRLDLLERLNRVVSRWQSYILFHNWLYDYKPIAEMGLAIDGRRVRDTMVRAFHLGNLPQGLKALSWRELGMTMQDFDDLVRPYSTEKVLDYYQVAQLREWRKPDERLEIDPKTGLWKLKKPQGMNTKLKRFFTDYGKNPDKDVFQMWEKNWVEEQAMMEAELGEWPGMDIAHAPFHEALYYACRDSDALYRLDPVLARMRRRVRRFPQEQWRDGQAA